MYQEVLFSMFICQILWYTLYKLRAEWDGIICNFMKCQNYVLCQAYGLLFLMIGGEINNCGYQSMILLYYYPLLRINPNSHYVYICKIQL